MANLARKKQSRRRLAALAFLSNISLDGTHSDTLLGVLNLNFQNAKCNSRLSEYNKNQGTGAEDRFKNSVSYSRRLTICDCPDSNGEKRDAWSSSEDKFELSFPDGRSRSFSKSKDRVQKFVTDTKAKLCTLSQKRKHLTHQMSAVESLGLPAGLSTESLTLVPHSRKNSVNFELPLSRDTAEVKKSKYVKEYDRNERLVLVSSKKVPFAIFSYVPLHGNSHPTVRPESVKPEGVRRRHNSTVRPLSIINDGPDPLDLLALLGIEKPDDGQDISFGHFLNHPMLPKRCRSYGPDVEHATSSGHHIHVSGCVSFDQAAAAKIAQSELQNASHSVSEKVNIEIQEGASTCRHMCHISNLMYNPNLLDDPELIAGKHCTLLAFPSYVTSIINYVKPSDLKKDLNDKFKEKFPHVCLTLSKLRSLKREMLRIARHECNIDLAIVAQAFVYFEKLILKILVNKQNRKLCAGACLLLSAKLNDVKGIELRNLIEKIETVFRVNRKDLICLEFTVLVALEFSLHLSQWEVLPHYQRLVYAS